MDRNIFTSFDQIFSSFEEAIVVLEENRQIKYLNTIAKRWLNKSQAEIESQSIKPWPTDQNKHLALLKSGNLVPSHH